MDINNTEECTIFVGNLDAKITEEILYELFLQAGPLKRVRIPIDYRTKKQSRFGFVTFKHVCSVEYAINLLNGITLFNSSLNISKKKRKDLAANGNSEENMNDSLQLQNFHHQARHTGITENHHQGYMHSPIRYPEHQGEFSSQINSDRPSSHEIPMPPMSLQMRRSQSFHNDDFYSPVQNELFSEDNRPGRQKYNNGRQDSPRPHYHHQHSPSVSDLKRSRSFNTPKHRPKPHNEHHFVNRDDAAQRHRPSRARPNERRVVAQKRHSKRSSYERSHNY